MSYSLKEFSSFLFPAFPMMQRLLSQCQQQGKVLILAFSDVSTFQCELTGDCCRYWDVTITEDYYHQWAPHFNDPESPYHAPFIEKENPKPNNFAHLRKKPGTPDCVFLGDDHLCFLHQKYGEKAKPVACQSYPYNAHINENFYSILYLQKSCHQGLAKQARVLYTLKPKPSVPPKGTAHDCYQLPLELAYLWVALVWDALEQSTLPSITTFLHLTKGLDVLCQMNYRVSSAQIEDLYLKQITFLKQSHLNASSFSNPPINQWIKPLMKRYTPHLSFVLDNEISLSFEEKMEFNKMISHFLKQKVPTQIYEHPFHGAWTLAQHWVILSIELFLLQAHCLYAKSQGRFMDSNNIRRSMQWVERSCDHTSDWLEDLRLSEWPDQKCLQEVQELLKWDIGA